MNIVLLEQDEVNEPLDLKDERTVHILNVLHKKTGDSFTAGIVGGKAGKAVITKIETGTNVGNDKHVKPGIYFDFIPEFDGLELNPLTLIVGFPRPIQLRRLFRDAAGLGVKKIIMCGTELGEKSYMQGDIAQPSQALKLLREGTVQAKSTHIPEYLIYETLGECIKNLPKEKDADSVLLALDNVNPSMGILDAFGKKNISSCVCAIGSERGWTDNERNLLSQAGFTLCRMGDRVLRTETAATVACSIILAKMGLLN